MDILIRGRRNTLNTEAVAFRFPNRDVEWDFTMLAKRSRDTGDYLNPREAQAYTHQPSLILDSDYHPDEDATYRKYHPYKLTTQILANRIVLRDDTQTINIYFADWVAQENLNVPQFICAFLQGFDPHASLTQNWQHFRKERPTPDGSKRRV